MLRAGVQVNNPGAIRFWQRMGFAITSEAEAQADGTICYQLKKSLRKCDLRAGRRRILTTEAQRHREKQIFL